MSRAFTEEQITARSARNRAARGKPSATGAGAAARKDAINAVARVAVAPAAGAPINAADTPSQQSTCGPATAPATVRACPKADAASSSPVPLATGGADTASRAPHNGQATHKAWRAKEAAEAASKVYPLVTLCRAEGLPEPVPEYRFHPIRKWRADYAWPLHKVIVEIDGGAWSGGRHTRGTGFIADMEKLNAAALLGFHVLRYTPQQLGQAMDDLRLMLAR